MSLPSFGTLSNWMAGGGRNVGLLVTLVLGLLLISLFSPQYLSLDNALNSAELRDFDRRVRELLGNVPFQYVSELKMDGLSMAAHYRQARVRSILGRRLGRTHLQR